MCINPYHYIKAEREFLQPQSPQQLSILVPKYPTASSESTVSSYIDDLSNTVPLNIQYNALKWVTKNPFISDAVIWYSIIFVFKSINSLQNSTLANYSVMDATMTQIPNNTSVIDTASMSSVGISTETPPPGEILKI